MVPKLLQDFVAFEFFDFQDGFRLLQLQQGFLGGEAMGAERQIRDGAPHHAVGLEVALVFHLGQFAGLLGVADFHIVRGLPIGDRERGLHHVIPRVGQHLALFDVLPFRSHHVQDAGFFRGEFHILKKFDLAILQNDVPYALPGTGRMEGRRDGQRLRRRISGTARGPGRFRRNGRGNPKHAAQNGQRQHCESSIHRLSPLLCVRVGKSVPVRPLSARSDDLRWRD